MFQQTAMTRRELMARLGLSLTGGALAALVGACTPAQPGPGQPATGGQVGANPTLTLRPSGSSPTPTTVSATSVVAAPTNSDTPRNGGTLRFGSIGDFATLDGQTTNLLLVDNVYGVWDRLTFYDSSLQPQPMLAESWDVSSDYRQIKFNLRKGVQFHTGRELTSDDVKWSLERLQDPKIGSSLTPRLKVMTAVDTPDKYTVVVKASRPWVEAFDFFEQANIIDPVTFQTAGISKPTGTGPFVFVEYVQGDHLRLVKNTNYWRSDRPFLDEVLISVHRDAQAAVVQLEAGALDILGYGLPVADAVRLRSDPNFRVISNDKSGSCWVVFGNCTKAPTNNKLVREALNSALDRKRMADIVWHGLSQPLDLPWSSSSPAYDADKNVAIGFDLEKASSLLARSGVSNIHLDVGWSTSTQDFATLAQIYQADLAKIGVDVALKPLEPAVYVSTRDSKSYQGILFGGGLDGSVRPGTIVTGPGYSPAANFAGFQDDAYTALAEQVLAESDPAKQVALYSQLNDYWLDQSWIMPLMRSPERHAARASVRGMRYDAHEALVLPDVWLA